MFRFGNLGGDIHKKIQLKLVKSENIGDFRNLNCKIYEFQYDEDRNSLGSTFHHTIMNTNEHTAWKEAIQKWHL